MIIEDINTAIVARLTSDGTLTAALSNTGVVSEVTNPVASPAAYPYVFVNVVSTLQTDAFNVDVIDCEFDVHILTLTADGLAAPTSIIERVYGNALSQAGRVPTYGLHRHAMGAIGSSPYAFTGSVAWRTNQYTDHDEDHFHFIESYKFVMSKAG